MNTEQIKKLVDNGVKVYWSSSAYEVIKDSVGQYLIKCLINNHCIGLTHRDGITLNGKPEEFFSEDRREVFLSELKSLMLRYNASISFEVGDCSDTYGIFDEKMVIEIKEKTVFSCNGWTIDGNDL